MPTDDPGRIAAVFARAICRTLEEWGLDMRSRAESSTAYPSESPAFRRYLSWNDFARMLVRCEDEVDEADYLAIGAHYLEVNGYFQAILRLGVPSVVLETGARIARVAFPDMVYETRRDGERWVLSIVLPRRYLGCRLFFGVTGGMLARVHELLGGTAEAISIEYGSHHGLYDMTLPERRPTQESLRAATRTMAADLERLFTWSFGAGEDARVDASSWLKSTYGLSPSEAEVTVLLARGHTVRSIADELYISPSTVRTHLKRVYRKTGVHRQAELVRLVLARS